MLIQKLFFIFFIIPLALTATTLKELASKYESMQKIIFIPISVGGITIIIPSGSDMLAYSGEAGNGEIEGVDLDGDGIRDEIKFKSYKT